MINRDLVETDIFKSLMFFMDAVPEENALDYILNYGMITADVSPESDLDKALKKYDVRRYARVCRGQL